VRFLRDHSLSLVLVALFVAQSVAFWFLGRAVWAEEASYPRWFAAEMMVSILADTWGGWLLVILTIKLREKNSAQSK
jgi:hypothetical protein